MHSQTGDLFAVEVGLLEEVAVRRRPDRLDEVAEIETARVERSMAKERERGELRGESRDPDPEQHLRRREADPHVRSSSSVRQRRPSTSSLACSRYVRSPPFRDVREQIRVASRPPERSRQRLGVSRRDEQGAVTVGEQLARGRRCPPVITGAPHAIAWKTLLGMTRAPWATCRRSRAHSAPFCTRRRAARSRSNRSSRRSEAVYPATYRAALVPRS